jgi:hypothetical protein
MEKPGGFLHCQTPVPRPLGKMQTKRRVKWHVVLPQTFLGQISTGKTDPHAGKEERKLNNKQ